MHEVKVKRLELLAIVKKNMKAHRDLFLKAQTGYRQAVIEELDAMLKEAREGKKIRRAIALPEPQDHTEDYNRVIKMLEMSVDKTIDLDSSSFDNYVRDQWNWKALADFTNMSYTGRRK